MSLSNHIAQLTPTVRHVRPGAQTDLQCCQDSRLAATVLTIDEVHIGAQVDGKLTMAHEVLAVNLHNHTRLSWLACIVGDAR